MNRQKQTMPKSKCVVYLLVIWLISGANCARTPGPPPPLLPDDSGIFAGPREPLDLFDPTVLKGKTIVIDPGHGGKFPGSVGPTDLHEAEVNLAVARFLGEMLREHGATAILTRETDRDFLTPEDSTLTGDLKKRLAIIPSTAQLFVSLHHNSFPSQNQNIRQIETYYKMTDDGPSLEFAHFIHRHLVRNLGIPEHKIEPGNYFILRQNPVTGILGEATYLSNPRIEALLRLPENQRLEAYAYFLGIVDYFMAGLPEIRILSPLENARIAQARPLIAAEIKDERLGIDPMSIRVMLDGAALPFNYDQTGRLMAEAGASLTNGPHELTISARNLNGNSAMRRTRRFSIVQPAAKMTFSTVPPVLQLGQNCLKARVTDAGHQPVADSVEVLLIHPQDGSGRTITAGWDTLRATTFGGEAFFYFDVETTEPFRMIAFCQTITEALELAAAPRKTYRHLYITPEKTAAFSGPVDIWQGAAHDRPDRNGHVWLPADFTAPIHISSRGYQPAHIDSAQEKIVLSPVADGSLYGRRIALDPEYGSTVGPTGITSAAVNLGVARFLADFLEAAGAEVTLIRPDANEVSESARVLRSYAANAERHLIIGTIESAKPVITHYTGSATGRNLAKSIAEAFGPDAATVREVSDYLLRQTACPILYVRAGQLKNPAEEIKVAHPIWQRAQAYRIFAGVLNHFGWKQPHRLSGFVLDANDKPITGALVVLDGLFSLQSDWSGEVKFTGLAAGKHTVEIFYQQRRITTTAILPQTEPFNFHLK